MKLPTKAITNFPRRAYNEAPILKHGIAWLRKWGPTAKRIAKWDAKFPPCEKGFLSDLLPEKWAQAARNVCDRITKATTGKG